LLTDPAHTRRTLMAAESTSVQFALVHDRLEDWVAQGGWAFRECGLT
jgi:hypothetical protein